MYTAAVITVSDKGYRGQRVDTSGPNLCEILRNRGYEVVHTAIVPDDREMIKAELCRCADEREVALVLTTGGTGFSPRDITPEATLAVVQRLTPGIPEAMRAESMRITPKGCLSRSVAGIRGRTLIVNLPGSKKASEENLLAVLGPVEHGLEMLLGEGSADCAAPEKKQEQAPQKQPVPSMDAWLKEAKALESAPYIGMYLTHNGIVRQSAKARVRQNAQDTRPVTGMLFDYDPEKVEAAVAEARRMPGIYHVRVWLNRGKLQMGDDIMYVLIGGDIRPHVVDCLQTLVGRIKQECVTETELYEEEKP